MMHRRKEFIFRRNFFNPETQNNKNTNKLLLKYNYLINQLVQFFGRK